MLKRVALLLVCVVCVVMFICHVRRPARRQIRLGTYVVEHPVGGRAAGRSWHGPQLCLADGLVDLHGQSSTAKTRARVSGRGYWQQASIPGVASRAEAAQLKTGSLVV